MENDTKFYLKISILIGFGWFLSFGIYHLFHSLVYVFGWFVLTSVVIAWILVNELYGDKSKNHIEARGKNG